MIGEFTRIWHVDCPKTTPGDPPPEFTQDFSQDEEDSNGAVISIHICPACGAKVKAHEGF